MGGVIPPTKLLLTSDDIVRGEFDNYRQIANYLGGVSINDKGIIYFMGEPQAPSYALKPDTPTVGSHWKKEDAIKDWIKCHMKLPRGYHIYRYLS